MKKAVILFFFLSLGLCFAFAPRAKAEDAEKIVQGMFDYMRGLTSISTVEMTIHRPDWNRSMTIKAWTKGTKYSIFFISKPPKDQGNGTLKRGNQMWMYNPKVNRTIKIPPSMMAQAWMGSDFSNNDLSKTDSIINDYVHTLEKTDVVDGKKVYTIKCMPKPQAPVVWGMQRLVVREDNILLKQAYFDQDLKPVKVLDCTEIKNMGGRLWASVWTMRESDQKEKYTVLTYENLEFNKTIPESMFSVASLSNPRM